MERGLDTRTGSGAGKPYVGTYCTKEELGAGGSEKGKDVPKTSPGTGTGTGISGKRLSLHICLCLTSRYDAANLAQRRVPGPAWSTTTYSYGVPACRAAAWSCRLKVELGQDDVPFVAISCG